MFKNSIMRIESAARFVSRHCCLPRGTHNGYRPRPQNSNSKTMPKNHITMTLPAIPLRPAALTLSKTCIYKTVGEVAISVDIYLPVSSNAGPYPVVLFIHGGAWLGSNKMDYSRPLFQHFLSLGFIVTSMDYRLLPETSIQGQLDDVRDIEGWLRNSLGSEASGLGISVEGDQIIVVGASAGAHLALLTPKLWATPPKAILSMYGPTDIASVSYIPNDRLSRYNLPPCSPELLAEATDYGNPPTKISIPKEPEDYLNPRNILGLHLLRQSLVPEFLLRGLVKDEGKLRLPMKGSVATHEIEEISPLAICRSIKYPPVYQVMGEHDDVFGPSHATKFHKALVNSGVPRETVIVPGMAHAFDNWTEIGEEVDVNVLRPAVEWVAAYARAEQHA